MKNRIAIIVGCLALLSVAHTAVAADASSTKAPAKSTVTSQKSMAPKGSYHSIHKSKAKLECSDCHESEPLADNTVKLRLHDTLPKNSPGPVNHETCFSCHEDRFAVGKYKK